VRRSQAVFLAAFGSAALALDAFAADTVIRNARIVTVSGAVIERGSLLISGSKVSAVGANVNVPAGANVIDGTGKTVYPGLVDGLTTIGLVEVGQGAAGTVDTNETGDVNPHAKAWVALHPQSDLIPVARANGVTSVLSAPGGGLISGQSALIRLSGSTPDQLVIKPQAAMHMVFPSGRPVFDITQAFQEPELRTFEERNRERRRNQEKELNRLKNLLEDAKAYGAALEAAKQGKAAAPKPDLPMEALAPAARGEMSVIMRADAEDDIKAAVKFAGERSLKLIVAGGLEAWRCADLLKQKDVAVLVNVDRLPRRESDAYDAAYANPAMLQRAGVRFAIVSDDASQVRNLPYEAAMARAYGLSADAAIRAITLSPAEIFGVSSRIGSLEAGKDANLFVATGDIMDHRSQVTHVFIDGVAQSLETRHTRLYEEFKGRP
jgi:imidazolonepropionase-like amidohydrolase